MAKLECLQVTGAFKIRGALSAVDAAHREDPQGAVITSSAGNHGLGIAHAASILGVPATVVVPANASRAKVKKLSGMTSSSSNLVRRTTTPNATPSNWPTAFDPLYLALQ